MRAYKTLFRLFQRITHTEKDISVIYPHSYTTARRRTRETMGQALLPVAYEITPTLL